MYEIPNVIKYFDCSFRYMIQKAPKSGIVLELRKVYDLAKKQYPTSDFQNLQNCFRICKSCSLRRSTYWKYGSGGGIFIV